MSSSDNIYVRDLPLLPLKDIVIFPQMVLPVFITEDICMQAVENSYCSHKLLFLSAFNSFNHDNIKTVDNAHLVTLSPPFDVYNIGTIAQILKIRKMPDKRVKILLQGLCRAFIKDLIEIDPFPIVALSYFENNDNKCNILDIKNIKTLIEKAISNGKNISPDLLMLLEETTENGKLADLIAGNLNLTVFNSQNILGTINSDERLKTIINVLEKENNKEEQYKQTSTNEEFVFKTSTKTYNYEQENKEKTDLEELKIKILSSSMSEQANKECLKQLSRLEKMSEDSAEANTSRTYIEWLLDLPWTKCSNDNLDLTICKHILDEDHYGLDKIKERILEFIAVRKLNPAVKGSILCFVGPPGVGKTSLGKSIARAINRKFVRISLGGLKDEAEIRGHRRTYVGSQPGRIIQAIKNAGTINPVLMLDEIDKLSNDYKGDPASALLEVLDPEQNNTFSDHYISLPFDLSQIIFIANANRLDTIPIALKDRLEIIEVSGYSEDEKIEIAKSYIVPKVIQQHGLNNKLIHFNDNVFIPLINNYTRETGLRSLEKAVASLSRKVAKIIAENDEQGCARSIIEINSQSLNSLLGEEKYIQTEHDITTPLIGVAVGLAYSPFGGEILELEVNINKGKGEFKLTGHLGDVMKESAFTALSFLRANAEKYGILYNKFSDYDIHLHIPFGAVPKDGPSAGIAIFMSLYSALKQEYLSQNIAMTGEISLHGKVLPIGGVREKFLAALRYGINKIIVPEKNKANINELPIHIKNKLNLYFVSNLEQVIEVFNQNSTQNNENIEYFKPQLPEALPIVAKGLY